ncbi:CrcB-like protein [Staphylococcus petrasii]|uniref:Fluoride-specific ion channel FluC n=1 Tax=Staphylococcus petrasii TaxID=1276936 RepID=A0A380G0Y0_9STAP|nr:fluoride efflux transporter CrcB [Staphylococcus petrasii]PNZ26706.1 fluoride efflux transporter CrcB [Staphylococcus petrasii]TGE12757.1 fluoride efflux transporter CrcB [Staphylococcus petrasii]TGE16899.1 fluoride efflux transporter CrcB [Staphylococcus petrasii]SUM43908.1 CrcB-like protein [Staphylococcus petrasii]
MINGLLIMLGGGLGAVVRAWLTDFTKSKWPSPLPIATLIVNIVGSFLIGLTFGVTLNHPSFSLFFTTGFLGGLTTFSTLSYELVNFITPKFKPLHFISYTILQFIVGFLACYLGYIL